MRRLVATTIAILSLTFIAAAAPPASKDLKAGALASKLAPLKDGGYRFDNELYQAEVDARGRLASLRVHGVDLLSPRSVNAKVYGASLAGGPDRRTPLDVPQITMEQGMVVARGDGREVSYRFRPDGIDFLFDLRDQVHWVFHPRPNVFTHLQKPDGQTVPCAGGVPVVAARVGDKAAIRVRPALTVHIPWVGSPGGADTVGGMYCNVGPGKTEFHLDLAARADWDNQIEVSIESPAADHLFPAGQPVRFDFKLNNHGHQPFEGKLLFAVEDQAGFVRGPQRSEIAVSVPAGGTSTATWRYQPDAPLVAKTLVELRCGDKTVLQRDLVFVSGAENYRPPLTRPDDFSAFWEATLKDMRDRPLDLTVTPAPQLSNSHKTVSLVSFTGLGGRRIEGWLVEPTAPGKYPAMFGARVQAYQWPRPTPGETADRVSLVMKLYQDGLYRSGMESRETAEFRHVYADYTRCVDVLSARDKVDPKRIMAVGASRTGPAALAAAALDHRVALVNIHVPTSAGISWPTRFYRGWGAHGTVARPAEVKPADWSRKRAEFLRLLAYFDMVNFAPDVKCPVIIGLGLRDFSLSPAPGIIAAYAYLPGDKALGVDPWAGHCYPAAFQKLEKLYRAKYLQLASP